ncbi:MAG: uncharacterized OsmC-like protein/fermentation-respiration switch protein FrsA (DUF1100 family) [Gammaproteobacteria bacterium]|jgi:uncharacterized OsmC-like protein/fermentation-respiration switch protein FrsA (DUF1100 family)
MVGVKVEFENDSRIVLAGSLEMPDKTLGIKAYALFAHCFTCGKDIASASRIARALAKQGIAVFRFDFTGLGNSDGDFSNSNFSSNIGDLVSAANHLAAEFQAPKILIGHSLGGAAVLAAAHEIPSAQAIVTIGAPSTGKHVEHLFSKQRGVIEALGESEVNLGGRLFQIKNQFLEDIDRYNTTEEIGRLNRALLIFHSPVDKIVSIDQAAEIYQAAKHPKSFISLDKADHLVSRSADAEYIGSTIASWASRYLEPAIESKKDSTSVSVKLQSGEVLITELDPSFLRGLQTEDHYLLADEPTRYGGSNLGPSPYDLLLMSLGACTSMTLRMYANRKKMDVGDINVRLGHERIHAEDCLDCKESIERLTRRISFTGNLDESQKQKMLEIADKCPVHKTLENNPEIVTSVE